MTKKNTGVMVEEEDLEVIKQASKIQRRSVASLLAQGGLELSYKIIKQKEVIENGQPINT